MRPASTCGRRRDCEAEVGACSMPMYIDEFGDRFITDGMFETLRLAPAPGTPVRPPDRRGHPALAEPPQRVAFIYSVVAAAAAVGARWRAVCVPRGRLAPEIRPASVSPGLDRGRCRLVRRPRDTARARARAALPGVTRGAVHGADPAADIAAVPERWPGAQGAAGLRRASKPVRQGRS